MPYKCQRHWAAVIWVLYKMFCVCRHHIYWEGEEFAPTKILFWLVRAKEKVMSVRWDLLVMSDPQEVLLAQFSLYVHKGGLKPDSFHYSCRRWWILTHSYSTCFYQLWCSMPIEIRLLVKKNDSMFRPSVKSHKIILIIAVDQATRSAYRWALSWSYLWIIEY